MSNDIDVVVQGWVGTDPVVSTGPSGVAYVGLRVGSTARKRAHDGSWNDRPTQWFTVKCFRELALNVGASCKKGTPVLVRGHLLTEHYAHRQTGVETSRMVIEASAVGLELSTGTANFGRTSRSAAQADERTPREDDPWDSHGAPPAPPEVEEAGALVEPEIEDELGARRLSGEAAGTP